MGSVWELLCVVGTARENKRKYLYKRKEKKVVRPITTITASAWGTSMQASWWILGSFHSARPHFFPCLKGSPPPPPPDSRVCPCARSLLFTGVGSGPLWSSLICTFPPCPVPLPLTCSAACPHCTCEALCGWRQIFHCIDWSHWVCFEFMIPCLTSLLSGAQPVLFP